MKHLHLSRPLAFFDLETTGINPLTDRIVEIAIIKILPDGGRESLEMRINPEQPIAPAASRIHGITDEDVKDKPLFRDVAAELAAFIEGCDLAGYNVIRFDIPMLIEEFKRAGVPLKLDDVLFIDAQVIYHKKEPRTLEAALRYYCGRPHEGAHQAIADVEATIDILEAQLGQYSDVPRDISELHRFCDQKNPAFVDRFGKLVWKDGEACLNFGPHKGKPLRKVAESDSGFLDWILRKDFSAEVKEIVSNATRGIYPVPPGSEEQGADAAVDEAGPDDDPLHGGQQSLW